MMGPTYNGEDLTGDDGMDDKNDGPGTKKQCVKTEVKEDADGTMDDSADPGAPGGFGERGVSTPRYGDESVSSEYHEFSRTCELE